MLDQRMLVREAADEPGFANAFHFSRAFKRIYGISPQMFLRQSRVDTTTQTTEEGVNH